MFKKNEWFKEIETNKCGRDFIVGDLHGHYSLLMHKLKLLNFDFEKDRLFSVGDLIDRGPEQLQCLSLLKESWFYAVMGNHEYMFLSEHKSYSGILNKIQAFLYSDNKKRKKDFKVYKEYVEIIKKLPVMIKVLDEENPFYIVHASRPIKKGVVWTDEKIEKKKHRKLKSKSFRKMLWGRKLSKEAMLVNNVSKFNIVNEEEYSLNPMKISGIIPFDNDVSLTYSGHTIMSQVVLHRSHLFIDGGKYKGGTLNIIEHKKLVDKLIKEIRK